MDLFLLSQAELFRVLKAYSILNPVVRFSYLCYITDIHG